MHPKDSRNLADAFATLTDFNKRALFITRKMPGFVKQVKPPNRGQQPLKHLKTLAILKGGLAKEHTIRIFGINIYDAPPPKFDIWGNPMTSAQQQEWAGNARNAALNPAKSINGKKTNTPRPDKDGFIDVFAKFYENTDSPDLR